MFDSGIRDWRDLFRPGQWSLADIGAVVFCGLIALALAGCGALGFLIGWLTRRGT